MSKKKNTPALGKGLAALMASEEEAVRHSMEVGAAEIPARAPDSLLDIGSIRANPFQPRREFSEVELEELAESIRRYGIIQPLTVRRAAEGGYELISGERRLRAAQRAGLERVPVYLRQATDGELRIMALIENIQRSDLNPLEVAESYQQILEEGKLTHEALAQQVGKSRTEVTNQLRLLELCEEAKEAVRSGALSKGHAKVLAGESDPVRQAEITRRVVAEQLSVRETTMLLKPLEAKGSGESAKRGEEVSSHPVVQDPVLEELCFRYGAGVKMHEGRKGAGRIELSFRNRAEKDALLQKLLSITREDG